MIRTLERIAKRVRNFGKMDTDPLADVPAAEHPKRPRVELHDMEGWLQRLVWEAELNRIRQEGRQR